MRNLKRELYITFSNFNEIGRCYSYSYYYENEYICGGYNTFFDYTKREIIRLIKDKCGIHSEKCEIHFKEVK